MADAGEGETGITARVLRGAAAGLVAGVLASFVMDRFQAAVSALSASDDDTAEPATSKAADKVARAATGEAVPDADKPLAGQGVHYLLGTGLGLAYGIAAEFRPGVTFGFGSAYGAGVAGVLDEIAVPAAELGNVPWNTGARTHLYTLASHLVFGTTAELARRQVSASLQPPS